MNPAKERAPEQGQRDVKARLPGLWLRVFAGGRRIWFIRGRLHGGQGAPIFVRLGEYPGMTEQQAERAAAEARDQLRQGINPNAARAAAAEAARVEGMTFGALVEEYLANEAPRTLSERTLSVRGYILRGATFAPWRDKPLSWIRQGHVDALRHGMPAGRQGSYLGALRRLLRYAVAHEYLDHAPSIKITPGAGDAAPFLHVEEGGAVDTTELEAVLGAISEFERQYPLSPWPCIWRFACRTGARATAVYGLRWEELDLGPAPTWYLPAERSKLKRPIAIPLSESAARLLRARPRREAGLVWPGRGGDRPLTNPGKEFAIMSSLLTARGFRGGFWTGRFRDTVMTWLDVHPAAGERAIALLVDHKAAREKTTRGRHYAKVSAEALARRLIDEWGTTVDAAQPMALSMKVVRIA